MHPQPSPHKLDRVSHYLSTARDFVVSNGPSEKQKALLASIEACLKKAEFLYAHGQEAEGDLLLETVIQQVDTLYVMG